MFIRGHTLERRLNLLEMHDTSFDTIPYTLNISGRLSFFLVIEYNIMITCKCTSHCRLVSLECIFFSQNVIFVKLFDPIRIDNEITLLDIWPAICNILTSDSISIWSTLLGLFRVWKKFINCIFSSQVQTWWSIGMKMDGHFHQNGRSITILDGILSQWTDESNPWARISTESSIG